MSRYTGPKCRLCRREGERLFLKGSRCLGEKCGVARKAQAPGAHGTSRRRPSTYGLQLREKQLIKRTYGVYEKPFRNYFEEASKKQGVTGELFLQLLERRLDNVVYRLGLSPSRAGARKLVTSGKVMLNGKKASVPSRLVQLNDVVMAPNFVGGEGYKAPEWLDLDSKKVAGKVLKFPTRDQISADFDEKLVVEFYSR